MTTSAPATKILLPLRIGQHEPLVWLISLLFTERFWDRNGLTRGGSRISQLLGLHTVSHSENGEPLYPSVDAIYQDAEEFIMNNMDAKACMDEALAAIEQRTLKYYSPLPDKWGEVPHHRPNCDIDSYEFLGWASQRDYPISEAIFNAAEPIVGIALNRRMEAKKQAHAYPAITAEDFYRLRKEPLWSVGSAIMYVMGHRARSEGSEESYTGNNGLFKRVLQYVFDAESTQQLQVLGYTSFPSEDTNFRMLNSKVIPEDFIAWVATLPIKLSMLSQPKKPIEISQPDYCTPDMALMYDAIKKFWSGYDLANPNPNVAPMKKDVVGWLVTEAQKRGILGFSKTRAEIMDTIIRCPAARKGGNSL